MLETRRGRRRRSSSKRGLKQTSRHRRDRCRDRQDPRRQCRQGRRISSGGKEAVVRLLRRPDDEGDAGQGQSAGGQRAADGQARRRYPLRRDDMLRLAAFMRQPAAARRGPGSVAPAAAGSAQGRRSVTRHRDLGRSVSADLFDEYRPHFTGGLARLANGTAFRNGYQAMPHRDLPRPFHVPDRVAPDAYGHRRQ